LKSHGNLFDAILTKPVNPTDLVEVVERLAL